MSGKKFLIIIVSAAVIVLIGISGIYYSMNSKKSETAPPKTVSVPSPTPTAISKPAPVTVTTARGIIVVVDNKELTIKYQDVLQVFSLTQTKDFQKVISGSVEKGDAKNSPSSLSELKKGQEVLIIHNIGSIDARSVYIIK